MRRFRVAWVALGVGLASTVATLGGGLHAQAIDVGCVAPPPMTFDAPRYIDQTRAGGEPIITTDQKGTVLVGAHAGTTHVHAPSAGSATTAAFVQNYRGQTYYYVSTDNGSTFKYVPRDPPANGNVPLSGFSDPDFAVDTAGNIYVSEINLVNVAFSKSTDGGKTYALQNLLAETLTDRQWSEGDEANVVYLVGNASGGGSSTKSVGQFGHILYKTKDGGKTFTEGLADSGGLGDLRVDKSDGTLYEANYTGDVLSMAAFRNARKDNLKPEINPIAKGVDMKSHWPSFDLDRLGNLYITWDETGRGAAKRPAGIYYAYSRDRGKTWSQPARVDTDAKTSIWPWLAVGEPGKVAIAWLDADLPLAGDNPALSGTYGWNVYVAQSLEGLGCTRSSVPAFTVVRGTKAPMHTGTVCMAGTACEGTQTDRRLGDYFAIAIDGKGNVDAVYSDTMQGGATGLAGYLHQSGGPLFGPPAIVTGFGGAGASGATSPQTAVQGATTSRAGGSRLPATGGNPRLALLALAIVLTAGGLWSAVRRRPVRVERERVLPGSDR